MSASLAHDSEEVGPVTAKAARRLVQEEDAKARFVDGLPNLVEPGVGAVREYSVRRFEQHALDVTHLNPSPLAMIPRMISRVPPRSENDGEVCSSKASMSANSLPSARFASSPRTAWTRTGSDCS